MNRVGKYTTGTDTSIESVGKAMEKCQSLLKEVATFMEQFTRMQKGLKTNNVVNDRACKPPKCIDNKVK